MDRDKKTNPKYNFGDGNKNNKSFTTDNSILLLYYHVCTVQHIFAFIFSFDSGKDRVEGETLETKSDTFYYWLWKKNIEREETKLRYRLLFYCTGTQTLNTRKKNMKKMVYKSCIIRYWDGGCFQVFCKQFPKYCNHHCDWDKNECWEVCIFVVFYLCMCRKWLSKAASENEKLHLQLKTQICACDSRMYNCFLCKNSVRETLKCILLSLLTGSVIVMIKIVHIVCTVL